jgi:RNA polymerase sigma-70 factor (ECF subfamily)
MMHALQAREDLASKLEQAFDLELLEAAMARVRLRVAPHTWEAFRLMAFEALPVAEVAARVRMQVAMVYVAKSKVQEMLRREVAKLETGG